MRLLAIVLASFAVSAALAQAAGEPAAYATASVGSLSVTSGIVLSAKDADMRGVWLDPKAACTVNRRLRVKAEINYIPFQGAPRRFVRSGKFLDPNCAEGGPNVGFTISARNLKIACPNGTWRPARYALLTETLEPTKSLKATASLLWEKRSRC